MRIVGLFEAKQKLSELVDRAGAGERIGITRHGKLTAMLVPATNQFDLAGVFKKLEGVRKRARHIKGISVKRLIEEERT